MTVPMMGPIAVMIIDMHVTHTTILATILALALSEGEMYLAMK